MSRKIAAAVTVAAVGVLCALAAVTLWLGPVGQRDALLQAAAAADGAVSGRMVALGRELEREGAKVAGANLIKEARELAGGRKGTGRLAAKTHLLQQKQQGAYPTVPAMNVGFSGSAPFKLGTEAQTSAHLLAGRVSACASCLACGAPLMRGVLWRAGKNGNKIYEAPHVGGTNGVYMAQGAPQANPQEEAAGTLGRCPAVCACSCLSRRSAAKDARYAGEADEWHAEASCSAQVRAPAPAGVWRLQPPGGPAHW
jgi:hypothetical protein